MATFRALFFAAIIAGGLAGLLTAFAHALVTSPIIAQGETFEHAVAPLPEAGHGHAAHEPEAWMPADGVERTAFTVLADILTGIGFALMLVACYALRGAVDWREGLLWGMAGFIVFVVAPGIGLPPELPGMSVAPLGPRQLWWVATAASTATALALLAFRRTPLAGLLAVLLIVVPHLVGAPQAPDSPSPVPEALQRHFVTAVTLTGFLFWAVLGVACALLHRRFMSGAPPAHPAPA